MVALQVQLAGTAGEKARTARQQKGRLAMAMKLVETAIRATTIRLRYANADDPSTATEWIDIQFAADDLKHPSTGNSLGDLAPKFLLEIQATVLHRARDEIDGEIQRLRDQRGRLP
jgi:hypothetical protein